MFAIVYGPASAPDGKTDAEYEAAEATRREEVVAAEPGCLLYQLVKNDEVITIVLPTAVHVAVHVATCARVSPSPTTLPRLLRDSIKAGCAGVLRIGGCGAGRMGLHARDATIQLVH